MIFRVVECIPKNRNRNLIENTRLSVNVGDQTSNKMRFVSVFSPKLFFDLYKVFRDLFFLSSVLTSIVPVP